MSAPRKTPQTTEGEKLPSWLLALVLAVACILGYFPVLSSGFLADDIVNLYVIENRPFWEIVAGGLFFRPVVWASFAIDRFIFGDWAVGFHLVNLAAHFATSLGVAACTQTLIRRPHSGLIAGLIFAWHPAHPEAVTWIAGRYDTFAGALLVWSLWLYLRPQHGTGGQRGFAEWASLLLFILACFSKEVAFVFPLVVLACEFLRPTGEREAKTGVSSRARRVIPFLIVAIVLFGLRWFLLGEFGGGEYVPEEAGGLLSSTVLYRAFVQPFKLLLLPLNPPLVDSLGTQWAILTRVILLLPLLFLLRGFRWRLVLLCALGIVILSLPTGYVGIYEDELRNSRFLYLPSIFFSLFIASLLTAGNRSEWLGKAASVLVVLYLATSLLLLHQNNFPWREAGKLVSSAAESTDALVEKHRGEWGDEFTKIIAYNVPRTYMGALAFDWGFPEMLMMRHGEKLSGVEAEVIHRGIPSAEDFRRMEQDLEETTVVWLFVDSTWSLVEYERQH